MLILPYAKKHALYPRVLDIMWTTCACVLEVLAFMPSSFIDDGYGFGVMLKTCKTAGSAAFESDVTAVSQPLYAQEIYTNVLIAMACIFWKAWIFISATIARFSSLLEWV